MGLFYTFTSVRVWDGLQRPHIILLTFARRMGNLGGAASLHTMSISWRSFRTIQSHQIHRSSQVSDSDFLNSSIQ